MDRFTQFHYTQEDLVSIADSMAQSESPFETALRPLLSLVDDMEYFIEKARKLCVYPSPHGLSEDESTLLYLYLDDWSPQSLHRILNQTLQSNDHAKIKPWLGFLQIFNAALEKLPCVTSTIWRGLLINKANKLSENEELVLCCITSCSSSKEIAKGCLNDQSVLCEISPLKGKDIRAYSPHPDDQEVLLHFGTRLRVKSKQPKDVTSEAVVLLDEVSNMSGNETTSNDVVMSSTVDEESTSSAIRAVVMFANGDRYHLSYVNGKKEGYGLYRPIGGGKLKGDEADQRANGEGICSLKDGTRFIGTFERGMRHGQSIVYHADKTIQVGLWCEGQLSQIHTGTQSDRGCYKWQDKNGQPVQYCMYGDNNGNMYLGNVANGKADGLGIRIWKNGSRYEGSFKSDEKQGYGLYTFPSGSKYFGEWMNDEINGEGTFKWPSGTSYTGSFRRSERHGLGKLTFPNGQTKEGRWKKNAFVG